MTHDCPGKKSWLNSNCHRLWHYFDMTVYAIWLFVVWHVGRIFSLYRGTLYVALLPFNGKLYVCGLQRCVWLIVHTERGSRLTMKGSEIPGFVNGPRTPGLFRVKRCGLNCTSRNKEHMQTTHTGRVRRTGMCVYVCVYIYIYIYINMCACVWGRQVDHCPSIPLPCLMDVSADSTASLDDYFIVVCRRYRRAEKAAPPAVCCCDRWLKFVFVKAAVVPECAAECRHYSVDITGRARAVSGYLSPLYGVRQLTVSRRGAPTDHQRWSRWRTMALEAAPSRSVIALYIVEWLMEEMYMIPLIAVPWPTAADCIPVS